MLRRLLQLYIGLVLYGVSTALFVHANLGADRAFRSADWLAAGGQIWRRNRHLRAVDWAADPAVPTVVQPARQPQRGQPSPGNSLLN